MTAQCEKEFNLKHFGLGHKKPIVFVTSTFGPKWFYPMWLAIQLIYHIIVLGVDGNAVSGQDGEPSFRYFLYIHNWVYMLIVLSNVIDLGVTVYVHVLARYILEERESNKGGAQIVMRNKVAKISFKTMGEYYKVRWYLKLTWVLFTMSTVLGMAVSLLYWILFLVRTRTEFKDGLLGKEIGEKEWEFGTVTYAFVSIVIIAHLFISAKPFRLLHFYMPWIPFLLYVIFTLAYQTITDAYIYRTLDWREVFYTSGLSAGLILIYLPLIHFLVYCIILIRTKLGEWCQIRYAVRKWRNTKKVRPVVTPVDTPGLDDTKQDKARSKRNLTQPSSQLSVSMPDETRSSVTSVHSVRQEELVTNTVLSRETSTTTIGTTSTHY